MEKSWVVLKVARSRATEKSGAKKGSKAAKTSRPPLSKAGPEGTSLHRQCYFMMEMVRTPMPLSLPGKVSGRLCRLILSKC